MKRFNILILTILLAMLVSCSTSRPMESSFVLPKMSFVRPTRPKMIEAVDAVSTQINLITMMGYAEKMESYSTILENYIQDIGAIYFEKTDSD